MLNHKEESIKDLLNFSIITIDKPSGPTSFQVSQFVKDLFNISKTSHFGTLDPMVSGILPIGLGRACRLSDFFMHKNKTYIGIMRLHEDVPEKKLKETVQKYIGKIQQLPPVRSRVKRAVREREVISFTLKEREGKDVLFETEVQAGTYIRKLIHDLGLELGGAHMLELRRTQAGIFSEPAITLYELEKAIEAYKQGNETVLRAMLIPADEALKQVLPAIEVSAMNLKKLLTGKPLHEEDINASALKDLGQFIVLINKKLIGVYKKVDEETIIARPLFVYN